MISLFSLLAADVRGLQDEEEEHEAVHAVPASQDSGGPPQAVLPH